MSARDLERTLEQAGLSGEVAHAHAARLVRLASPFDSRAWHAWFVPGRLEVLGKHTDYAGGRSLLCAAERGFCVVSAPRADGRLVITDTRREATLVLDPAQPETPVKWATYPLTVQRRLARNFPNAVRGADIRFESDLPSAAGLSSSSALMIAVLLALVRANDLDADARWREAIASAQDLAGYAATIENGRDFRSLTGEAGVGTEGGSEDHTAILCSLPGHLRQYRFLPTTRERTVALPPHFVFAIGVSGVAARKTGEARDDYNRASRSVARLLELWRLETGRTDGTLATALASDPDAPARLRARLHGPDAPLVDRLDQFVEESTVLVPAAADQVERGDFDGFGATVARSQALAERLLHNQVPETIALARTAREEGAIAASAFGAGFGGSVWALVDRADAHAFLNRWQNAYAHASPPARGQFFLTVAGPAAVTVR